MTKTILTVAPCVGWASDQFMRAGLALATPELDAYLAAMQAEYAKKKREKQVLPPLHELVKYGMAPDL